MKQLTQPSTYAGFAALLQLAAAFFPQYSAVLHAATAAAGAAAVALNEKPAA